MSLLQQGESGSFTRRPGAILAPALALVVVGAWLISLWYSFFHMSTGVFPNSLSSVAMMLWIQFLYCGLFIVTHDACHGTACPGNPRLNRWLGKTTALLYAAFNFDDLVPKHLAHHVYVATAKDPDFHDCTSKGQGFLDWGWRFFRQYLRVRQIFIMMAVAQVLFHVLKIPERNVIQFWVVPAIMSGIQLFFFGTWLPHRQAFGNEFTDRHHARDLGLPWILSLVSCWHFGYHHTHHLQPAVPWFRLPSHRRQP
jgi:beta-carotene ketolase (CrtW type)